MHPSIQEKIRWFDYAHLPEHLQWVSRSFGELANKVASACDGPQATIALQKLVEAKDAAMRGLIVAQESK